MKRVINGKLYNTETAKYIWGWSYGASSDFSYISEVLYQKKKTRELFLYGEGGPRTKYGKQQGDNCWGYGEAIIPESEFDVRAWVSEYCDVGTYIRLFGPVFE